MCKLVFWNKRHLDGFPYWRNTSHANHSIFLVSRTKKISKAAEDLGKTQRVLLQINSSGENTKAGISLNSKKEILECINMSGIKVEGLMTMGPNTKEVNLITTSFQKTKKLFGLNASGPAPENISIDYLFRCAQKEYYQFPNFCTIYFIN